MAKGGNAAPMPYSSSEAASSSSAFAQYRAGEIGNPSYASSMSPGATVTGATGWTDSGSSVDWSKVFAGFGEGIRNAPGQLSSPFGQSGSESWPTLASPIQFQTVAQFLASLQGKGGKR